ncbi:DUF1611 domain-containing protein [Methanopyrus sp.]
MGLVGVEHPSVDRAVLVPFTKVAAGILRFSDVDVVGACDYRDHRVGKKTTEVVGEDVEELEIRPFEELGELLEEAEWLIWTKEVFDEDEHYLRWREAIDLAVTKGVNVYNMGRLHMVSQDPNWRLEAHKRGVEYFDASDPELYLEYLEYGIRAREEGIDAEVVTVVGTGRRTGKFTTLNVTRKVLEEEGVDVRSVGTEPSSLLVGCEAMVIPQVLPMGHAAGTVYGAVKRLDEEYEPDVILVGSQTGVTADPLEVGTGRGGALASLTILLGSDPDKMILATRPELKDRLQDAAEVATLLTGARIQFVSVNGKDLSESEVRRFCREVESELGYPAADPLKMPEEFRELVLDLIPPG